MRDGTLDLYLMKRFWTVFFTMEYAILAMIRLPASP